MAEQTAALDLAVDIAAHTDIFAAAMDWRELRVGAVNALAAEEGVGVKNDEDAVERLKEKCIPIINAVGPAGATPLIVACLQDDRARAEALLALGADPAAEGDLRTISDPTKKYKLFPLAVAARDGFIEIAKLLSTHEKASANQASTDEGRTALFFGCQNGRTEVVKLLLAHNGIEVNKARTDNGSTPLNVACQNGHIGVVKLLMAHSGVGVNTARTTDGMAPLVVACHQGHTEVVKLLLAHIEIEVNNAMTNGTTPLFVAFFKGHTGVIKLLLAHDAIEVNKAMTGGSTPLHIACHQGHTEGVKLLLAHHGIEVNKARTGGGGTPLYMACRQGHTEVVKLLLAHIEIEVNNAMTNDTSPLFVACFKGHTGVIKLLLAHDDVDVNKADTTMAATPLHAAANAGKLLAAQLLVLHGARLTALTTTGATPAQLAIRFRQPVLVEWLNAVAGWSQLRVAAGCRLHTEAALLLRKGKVDPDDPATTTVKDIMAVIATANSKPAALSWQNAPQICKATQKLMVDATRGWHRTTHWLHHAGVRKAVYAVMVVAGRLEKKDDASSCSLVAFVDDGDGGRGTAAAGEVDGETEATAALPVLPIDMWFHAMSFFKRSWWAVNE